MRDSLDFEKKKMRHGTVSWVPKKPAVAYKEGAEGLCQPLEKRNAEAIAKSPSYSMIRRRNLQREVCREKKGKYAQNRTLGAWSFRQQTETHVVVRGKKPDPAQKKKTIHPHLKK